MKKFFSAIVLMFCVSFMAYAEPSQPLEQPATESETLEQTDVFIPDEYMYQDFYADQSNERLFVEYNISLYSNYEIEITDMEDIDTSQLNTDGRMSLSIGTETDSFRFAVSPAFQTVENAELGSIDLSLDFFPKRERLSPFIGIQFGFNWIDVEDSDISETAFGYGIHAGMIYDIADNLFFKVSFGYDTVEFDIDDDLSLELSGFNLSTGFGFRF